MQIYYMHGRVLMTLLLMHPTGERAAAVRVDLCDRHAFGCILL